MSDNINVTYLKQVIKDVKITAEEDRDGEVVDLCRILLKVIKQYQHYGIDYVIKNIGKKGGCYVEKSWIYWCR